MHIRNAILFIAILLFSAAYAPRAMADQTFMERLHDLMTREKTDPTKTLQAPFIKPEDMKTPTADAMGLPYDPYFEDNSKNNLAEPHRDEDQISSWLTDIVSEELSVLVRDYKDHMEAMRKIFSAEAITGYNQFLIGSGMMNALTSNHRMLHAFVEDKPMLLNEGVVDGRYHWLYDVPVTLNSMSETANDYETIPNSENIHSVHVLVRVQLGRVAEQEELGDQIKNESSQGLKVESWDVRKNPAIRKDE